MASVSKRPDGQWRARYRDEAARNTLSVPSARPTRSGGSEKITASGHGRVRQSAGWPGHVQGDTPSGGAAGRCIAALRSIIESALRRHAYPVLGDRPMSAIKPSDAQAWAKRLTERLAPSSVRVMHGVVAGMFRAAMRDRLIAANPCDAPGYPRYRAARLSRCRPRHCPGLADAV